ncbi:MAG: glycosyltransferase family 2 protein [Deltaproteobacteria bacterium]|nr:glycosyltransferase family 2 protein [Deltaproteobacteria bacterium]
MIDVIVPVYGQLPLVAQCVDCLAAQHKVGRIFLVDDCSPGSEIASYASTAPVHYLRMSENTGFVGSVTVGMKEVETEYAVLVNSDTAPIGKYALHRLVYTMHENDMHVAGPKLLFMRGSKYGKGGTIQHAGVAFDPDGIPYHPFMHLHRDTKAANIRRRVNAVSGAVMAVNTEAWHALGGFDQAFAPGVYEDVDFCLRSGKVLYVPRSEWWHVMHGSQVKGNNLFSKSEEHLGKLQRKWGIKCDEEIYYGA